VVLDPASPAGLDVVKTLANAAEYQHPVTIWARKLVIKSFCADNDDDDDDEVLAWIKTISCNMKGIQCLEYVFCI
jgi:hypothetical protein